MIILKHFLIYEKLYLKIIKKKKLKKKFISKEIEVIIIFNHKFNIKISN